jgi:hypothetical protein
MPRTPPVNRDELETAVDVCGINARQLDEIADRVERYMGEGLSKDLVDRIDVLTRASSSATRLASLLIVRLKHEETQRELEQRYKAVS